MLNTYNVFCAQRGAKSLTILKTTKAKMAKKRYQKLAGAKTPVPIKLSLLWAVLMSLYIYNDYFILFVPGVIEDMAAGHMGPLGEVTDLKLVAVAIILAIPAVMIFLSSGLPATLSRSLNVVLGSVYAVIAALTLIGSPPFYRLIVVLEIIATILIVWLALRWPNEVIVEE